MSTVEEPVQAVLAQADDQTGIDIGAQEGAISDSELRSEFSAPPRGRQSSSLLRTPRTLRYSLVLHVEASTLENGREPGRSELEDGTRVSAETSRRLSCDASVVRLTKDTGEAGDGKAAEGSMGNALMGHGSTGHGSIHLVGRKTRTIPPALRRALDARDRGCRFPGCGLRFTDAHHIRHWADGGETKLENLTLLYRFHHRLVHDEGYTVHFPRGEQLYFLDPKMRLIPDQPPPTPPLPLEPTEALVRQNHLRAVEPGCMTSADRCKREDDIPLAVTTRAIQAIAENHTGPS